MSKTDATVGATEVLDHMQPSQQQSSTASIGNAFHGKLPRLLCAWTLFAATVFGIAQPVSSYTMTMEPSFISVTCNGSYGSIGRISGAGANESISFVASPSAQFLPARTSSAGNYSVIWKCDPDQAGTRWNVVATGATSGRTASFSVVAEAAPLPTLPAAGTNLLTNPGAESGSTTPWMIIDQPGTTTLSASATSLAQSGSRAFLASNGSISGGSIGQDITGAIQPGTTFTYSLWARHAHAAGTPQSASIVLETIGGDIESAVLAITVSEVWQRFDVTLSVGSSGHTGLRSKLVMLTPTSTGRGTYVLDAASLTESSPNPFGTLEVVTGGTSLVRVKGYAIDPNQPYDAVPILVTVGAEQTQIAADVVRSDVASMYPTAGPVHGFDTQIPTTQTGSTQVCVTARNLGVGADTTFGCVTVVIGAVATTIAPTTAAPTTTVPVTTVPATTTPVTTATPTTATPTTATPTTATPTTATPTTATPTTATPTTATPTTATPTTATPTTVTPTTVTPTTATPTTATPTTVTPTTVTPTTATPTTVTPTTAPEPLGPQALAPTRVISLFDAGDLASLTRGFDFQAADADTLRLYWAFFSREPDIAGAKYWIGLSRAGMSLDEIAFNFAQSVEFKARYGSVADHEFLDIVYQNVLGRRYDAAGFNYWLSVIDLGLPRSGAVRWIAANAEFVRAHPYPAL